MAQRGASPAAPDGLAGGSAPMDGTAVQPPAWLSEVARGYWHDLLRHLPAGVLRAADAHAYGMLCNELATYAEADQLVQEAGILITDAMGSLQQNPALPIRERASAAIARWSAYLRITPDHRVPKGPGRLRHRVEQ